MAERIRRTDEAAAHMLARHGVTTAQADEVLGDVALLLVDPYPPSRVRAAALIGWSPTARRALLVLAYRDLDGRWTGMNAWPATGGWLRAYLEGASQ